MSEKSIDLNNTDSVSLEVSFLESSKQETGRINKKRGQQNQNMSDTESEVDQKLPDKRSRNLIKQTGKKGGAKNANNYGQQTKGGNKRKANQKLDDIEKQNNKKVNMGNQQPQQTQQAANTFLYSPGERFPDLSEYVANHSLIEIRVASEFLTKYNKYVINRSLWGNDTYTSESDIVCMLVHSGIIDNQFNDPNIENYEGVSLFCKVSKSKKNYSSSLRYGFLSRQQKNYAGYALKPETHQWLPSLGKDDELTRYAQQMATWSKSKRVKSTQAVPINHKYLQTIPEVNLVFNLNNEPAYKYSCMNICDKGSDTKTWKSYKLKNHVLYLDTAQNERYEISREKVSQQQQEEDNLFNDCDQYRLAKIINPYACDNQFMNNGQTTIPLKKELVNIIFEELDWSEILWGSSIVTIKTHKIENIVSYKLYLRSDSE